MKTNYHTHTERCKHAYGSEEEFILAAIEGGIEELGFADHTPWPFKTKDFEPRMRMKLSQFQDYLDTCTALKEKYKDQISIKIGLECEYYEEYIDWLEHIAKNKVDYLIFGNHYAYSDDIYPIAPYMGNCVKDPVSLQAYVESSLKGIRSGLFSYFAHPDLFMRCYPQIDEHVLQAAHTLCKACADEKLPLEINLSAVAVLMRNPYSLYPCRPFYEIAKSYGCSVIIGYDAHTPDPLKDRQLYEFACKWIDEIGLHRIEKLCI